ncbi:hypothetical protein QR680_012283 [Steinernema hermaphroditum]|uniref:Pescadillo homolog n=1 Tax=Steinernema hermaphroditum TaxID=289476 RepID=A0AA39M094_9BILA|nr:hypothetical protein QR680_012283 [Steinernema hermaphroditum]
MEIHRTFAIPPSLGVFVPLVFLRFISFRNLYAGFTMRIKKKFSTGTATNFVSRTQAIRKLQLSLKDFKRLCILKGIFPREPIHKKKANKGSTQNKIYYYAKDINYLAAEPIINKFREYKGFLQKLKHAKAKRDTLRVRNMYESKEELVLDHLVKERFPTFSTALRDLDDALCVMFAFAVLPHTKIIKPSLVQECRRLTAEFMHYVIESHSLMKTFISIKGIYYQAEIMGEKITWLVGHERAIGRLGGIDLSVMANFAEFYITMLRFVNFRLYKQLGLYYPPQIQTGVEESKDEEGETVQDQVFSLARPLARTPDSEEKPTIDTFTDGESEDLMAEKLRAAEALRTLFSKCRFFINRECPKEALAFVIRSCGGTVSWEYCPGMTYSESDPRITHHVIDRPLVNGNMSRTYVQPQWVFDCLNARRLLPVAKYLPGETLPPHLSPFVEEKAGDYIPPERIEQLKQDGHDVSKLLGEVKEPPKKVAKVVPKKVKKAEPEGMRVELGQTWQPNAQLAQNDVKHGLKLREMMIAKKHRRVYHKIKHGIEKKKREVNSLHKKREILSAMSAARAATKPKKVAE